MARDLERGIYNQHTQAIPTKRATSSRRRRAGSGRGREPFPSIEARGIRKGKMRLGAQISQGGGTQMTRER